METMGQRIKKTRKMMKMTQVEFAKLLDVPQPSISAYEKDKYLPSFEVIGKIMKEKNRSSFSGKLGFVLSAAGASVGLGNI